jgi:phosphoglucomutase
MNSLYEEYGVYQHSMINAEFEGAQGMETMKSLMSGLRENLPDRIAGLRVVRFADYLNSVAVDIKSGSTSNIDLPKSNVLSFGLEGGNGLIVRPSGTEPKIKAYITSTGTDAAAAANMAEELTAAARKLLGV